MSKRAVILAGGKGMRLRPYTVALPKPLVPIGETPILEIIVKQLVRDEFDHITITVNHLAEVIKAFFGDGRKWGVKIDYSLEDSPLSTMGPLSLIPDLPRDFLVMNGDILSDLNYSAFLEKHIGSGSLFTISSYKRAEKVDYGILKISEKDDLVGFQEKPSMHYDVSMGVYAVNQKILQFIPYNTRYGFDDLMLAMIREKNYPKVIHHAGYWLDIGRPDDYERASKEADTIIKKLI
ncbi:MAG: sugar phosphate nucleotidyltransferase [Candidatus Neomarinimicrobiota bacterium]|jgi:NDP-sugar pyrophosphorylase family protein|nr:sugar phosphate nucleotidyltransferase [Candidatus Neomarinimicrobiota bacterium]MDD4962176.1 sugar phosphate nucleotidyltransferase [Candidatus Neomarinimicrobiota bacterium]MDX9780376.1 sugar phosphate nucleotidyltransferase [bacterium]